MRSPFVMSLLKNSVQQSCSWFFSYWHILYIYIFNCWLARTLETLSKNYLTACKWMKRVNTLDALLLESVDGPIWLWNVFYLGPYVLGGVLQCEVLCLMLIRLCSFYHKYAHLPNGRHTDRTDSVTQCMHWTKSRIVQFFGIIPMPYKNTHPFST